MRRRAAFTRPSAADNRFPRRNSTLALAIFDLDYTLLRGDSDHAWGEFLVERNLVAADEYRRQNDRFYAQYQAGTLDIHEYLKFALYPLTQHDRATLSAWHREFMEAKIRPMISARARELVDSHRRRGDSLLIITSTNRFITEPIAREFGIDQLLATDAEVVNGRYTGRVAGEPCFREGKVTRLRQWLEEHNASLDESYCYSDSHNDLPLLDAVRHAVAVNPDAVLRAEAARRGWPIIDLHQAS